MGKDKKSIWGDNFHITKVIFRKGKSTDKEFIIGIRGNIMLESLKITLYMDTGSM